MLTPVWCEVLTLSEEEDLLSEAPQRVSSNEEPPIELTSRSMMDSSIEPPKLLSPNPMAESDKKEDIMVDESTFRS